MRIPRFCAVPALLACLACGPVDPTRAPPGMARVAADFDHVRADFYIDSYEAVIVNGRATSTKGQPPEVNVDYAGAKSACESAGKRLCTLSEWRLACRGPKDHRYGFQDSDTAPNALTDVCDVARTTDNTPGSLPSLTGAHPKCRTEGLAVWDLIGNLTEWATREDGVPVAAGAAFYQPSEGSDCEAMLSRPGDQTMVPAERTTDLGFRCCKDAPALTHADAGTP